MLKRGIRLSIGVKIFFAVSIFAVLLTGIIYWQVSVEFRNDLYADALADSRSEIISLQETLGYLAKKGDAAQMQRTVTSLSVNVDIKNAFLIDESNTLIAATRIAFVGEDMSKVLSADVKYELRERLLGTKRSGKNIAWLSADGQSMFALSPIVLGRNIEQSLRSDKIGVMVLHRDMGWITEEVKNLVLITLLPIVGGVVLLGLALLFYFHFSVNRRIGLVNAAALEFSAANFDARIEVNGNDEIADMGRTFNAMAEQLKDDLHAMQLQDERLSHTQEMACMGSWEMDLTSNQLSWTDEVFRIFGCEPQSFSPSYAQFIGAVHSEDRELISDAYNSSVRDQNDGYELEHRIIRKDSGEIRYVYEKCIHEKDEFGVVIRSVGMVHDITERKKSELALQESGVLLENVLNSTSDLIFVKNLQLQTVLANKAYAKAVGKAPEEMYGLTDIENGWDPDLVKGNPEKGIRGFETDDKEALAGNIVHNPYDPANIEGEIRIFDTNKHPLRSAEGDIIGMVGVARDLTERIKSEEKIKYHEIEQREILNSMLDGVITIDELGTILTFNKAAEVVFGYPINEVLGKNIRMMMAEPFASSHDGYLKRYLETGNSRVIGSDLEVEGKRKDDSCFPMRLSVAELPNSAEGTQRYIGSCQDLTKLKLQDEQLRQSRKMDALGKLTGGVAHDYNNMLGVVIGYAELLTTALKTEPKLLGFAQQIHQAGKRSAKLTHKLLSFSGTRLADPIALDLNELLRNEQQMLEKTLTVRIALGLNLAEDLSPIFVDGGDLEDAILNMCINAMFAIEERGSITIRTANKSLSMTDSYRLGLEPGEYVELFIADSGQGMDKAIIEKIFDPFYSTKGERGTGLGLSQVYGFIERSDGAITVESELNIGTTFTMYFPRYLKESSEDILNETIATKTLLVQETILVVDDEPALVSLAMQMLSDQGYTVLGAQSGEQALEILQKEDIDLLLSDVVMPGMDGYELAMAVQEKYPSVKIQLVSGFSEESPLKSANETLHRQLINKPYSSGVLLDAIRGLLAKK